MYAFCFRTVRHIFRYSLLWMKDLALFDLNTGVYFEIYPYGRSANTWDRRSSLNDADLAIHVF